MGCRALLAVAATALVFLVSGCGPPVAVSPLAAAARAGNVTEIDRLVATGADIDAGSGVNNWPPVIHAVHKGQVEALEHLLERGAALGGETGRIALEMARRDRNDALIEVLTGHHVPHLANVTR